MGKNFGIISSSLLRITYKSYWRRRRPRNEDMHNKVKSTNLLTFSWSAFSDSSYSKSCSCRIRRHSSNVCICKTQNHVNPVQYAALYFRQKLHNAKCMWWHARKGVSRKDCQLCTCDSVKYQVCWTFQKPGTKQIPTHKLFSSNPPPRINKQKTISLNWHSESL